MKFKAVFFDMDDTLCDFTDSERKARRIMYNRVAKEQGLDPSSIEEAYREYSLEALKRHPKKEVNASNWPTVRDFRTEVWGKVLSQFDLYSLDTAVSLASQHEDVRRQHLRLYPDALPILNSLHGRFPLGLISNGPVDVQRDEAILLDIIRFFDFTLFEGELGFGKPDRRIFDLGLAQVGSTPAETIFIGDTLHTDILGAKEAGLWAAWVNRNNRSREDGDPQPDFEIADLGELETILFK